MAIDHGMENSPLSSPANVRIWQNRLHIYLYSLLWM